MLISRLGSIRINCCVIFVDLKNFHVFLGRPWQYDYNNAHNGVMNVFTLEKDGNKFSLIPLHNEDIGRRILSIGNCADLEDFEKVGDQHGKKTYGTLVVDVKKKK